MDEYKEIEKMKIAAKAGIIANPNYTREEKEELKRRVDNAGEQTKILIEICKNLGIKL